MRREGSLIAAAYFAAGALFVIISYRATACAPALQLASPAFLFAIVYAILCFAIPALTIATSQYKYVGTYDPTVLVASLVYFMTFGLVAIAVFVLMGGNRLAALGPELRSAHWRYYSRSEMLLAAVILLLPALLALIYWLQLIMQHGLALFWIDRIRLMRGKGYLMMPLAWPFVFMLLYYGNAAFQRTLSVGQKVTVIALALTVIVTAMVSGSRTTAIAPILVLAVGAMLLRQRGLAPRAVLALTAIMVIGVLLGTVRSAVMAQSMTHLEQNLFANVVGDLNRDLGEAETVWWVNHRRAVHEFAHGSTIAAVAVGAVPRSSWPNKPLGGGPVLRNSVHPGSYNLYGTRPLSSYTPGLAGEAFMNFGWFGVIFVSVPYGVLLWAIAYIGGRMRSGAGFALWGAVLFCALFFLKTEVFGVSARLFSMTAPLLLFWATKYVLVIRLGRQGTQSTPY
jgi:hypothetical protein